MSGTPLRTRAVDRQRGAAAVEAALVISFFLVPILIGVLTWGERLWAAQRQEPYPARIVQSELVGRFSCAELVQRIKSTLASNSAGLDLPLQAEWIAVEVVDVLPVVGALVEVTITVPALEETGSPTVTELSYRLQHVSVTTESCL